MAVTFNPDKGIVVDDGQTVRSNIAADWVKAFKTDDDTPDLNAEPETPAGQLIDGQAALVIQKDNEILQLANMFNPVTATGIFQDALGKIYFITRKIAQPTTVTCTCHGMTGTRIPKAAIVEDENGNRLEATESAMIGENGTIDVLFSCVESGPVLINQNTIHKIVTVVPGWDSVENKEAGVMGRNEETQQEFEERRINSVAKNSHGIAESIEGNINSLDGVIACRVEQNRTGETITMLGVQIPPHSIYLSVYGGESSDIGNVIHHRLDAGCGTAGNTSVTVTDETNGSLHKYYYTVPTTVPVYIKITTNENALYNKDLVTKSIVDNFNGVVDLARIEMGDVLYASRFYQTAISAGLTDLIKIELSKNNNDFESNIEFALNEMPTISYDDITFVGESS